MDERTNSIPHCITLYPCEMCFVTMYYLFSITTCLCLFFNLLTATGGEDARCLWTAHFGRLLRQSDPLCALRRTGWGLAHLHSTSSPHRNSQTKADTIQIWQVCVKFWWCIKLLKSLLYKHCNLVLICCRCILPLIPLIYKFERFILNCRDLFSHRRCYVNVRGSI